ncbi:hypothetical protein [Methylomonas sp. CM2]|uniref:hypothetical protein n=1 Tax=Methylomonas sp. CM2 TaxID=3417647 RepID=UPI003CF669C0
MDIFNNREVAKGLWLLAISVYVFLSPKMVEARSSFRHLLSAFFVKQIMSILGLMVVYMALVVYFLSEMDLWNAEQIKNTVFWCGSVGFMSLFKIESIKKDKSFFKHSVIDNLKLLAILQFVVGVYTFPSWIELLLARVAPISDSVIGGMLTSKCAITQANRTYIFNGSSVGHAVESLRPHHQTRRTFPRSTADTLGSFRFIGI